MDPVIGAQVVNKDGEMGEITVFDWEYITVAYCDRAAMYLPNAFEKRFLKYLDEDLQKKVEESMAQAKQEAAKKQKQSVLIPPKSRKPPIYLHTKMM